LFSGWNDLIRAARDHGLAYLEKVLRDAEADPSRTSATRFKHADDVAAVLIAPA